MAMIIHGFYAVGECACISVHGANRLGSNSLIRFDRFWKSSWTTFIEFIKKKTQKIYQRMLQKKRR